MDRLQFREALKREKSPVKRAQITSVDTEVKQTLYKRTPVANPFANYSCSDSSDEDLDKDDEFYKLASLDNLSYEEIVLANKENKSVYEPLPKEFFKNDLEDNDIVEGNKVEDGQFNENEPQPVYNSYINQSNDIKSILTTVFTPNSSLFVSQSINKDIDQSSEDDWREANV